MKINRKMNLVLPIYDGDDKIVAYVHHTPIPHTVFEAYFLTISRAYVAMQENGAEWLATMGPRTAYIMLQKVAETEGSWAPLGADGKPLPNGVKAGLLPALWRQTFIVSPGAGGWEQVPFETAEAQQTLSPEDFSEVRNAVTFFTLVSACRDTKTANTMLTDIFGLYDGLTTSSNVTEYMSSLPTLTPAEPTGEKQTTSSLPV